MSDEARRKAEQLSRAAWLEMLRNRTSHLYDDAQAREVYEAIKRDFGAIEKAYAVVRRRLGFTEQKAPGT